MHFKFPFLSRFSLLHDNCPFYEKKILYLFNSLKQVSSTHVKHLSQAPLTSLMLTALSGFAEQITDLHTHKQTHTHTHTKFRLCMNLLDSMSDYYNITTGEFNKEKNLFNCWNKDTFFELLGDKNIWKIQKNNLIISEKNICSTKSLEFRYYYGRFSRPRR